MPARQHQTTVGTTATAIEGTQYQGWMLVNTHATETLYLGDSTVATSDGFPIPAGATFSPSDLAHRSLQGKDGDRLYGRVGTGTVDVRVLIQGARAVRQ